MHYRKQEEALSKPKTKGGYDAWAFARGIRKSKTRAPR